MTDFWTQARAERARQDTLWGSQSHPDGTGRDGDSAHLQEKIEHYRRVFADWPAECPEGTWRDIWETWSAKLLAETDAEEIKQRLVKMAAIAANWHQTIVDRDDT